MMLLSTTLTHRCISRPLFALRNFLYVSFACTRLETKSSANSRSRKSSGFSKLPKFERLELLHLKESPNVEGKDKSKSPRKPSKLKSWSLLTPAFCNVIVAEVCRRSCSHDMKFLTKVLHDAVARPTVSDIASNDDDAHKALQTSLRQDKSYITLTSLVANGRHEIRWFYALLLDLLRGKKLSKAGFSKMYGGLSDPDIAAAHQKFVLTLHRYKRKCLGESEIEEKQIKVASEQLSSYVPTKTLFQLMTILDSNASQKKFVNTDNVLKIMDMHADILLLPNVRNVLGLSLSEKAVELIEKAKSEKYFLCSQLTRELEDFTIRIQNYRHFLCSFPSAVPSVTSFVKEASMPRPNLIPKATFQYTRVTNNTINGYDIELQDETKGYDQDNLLPNRRVFIGNLPLTATADIIRETFCRCGSVSHVHFYAAHDDFNLEEDNNVAISKSVSKAISDVITAERISEETVSEEFEIDDYDETVDEPVQSLKSSLYASQQKLFHIDEINLIPINDIAKKKKRRNLLAIEKDGNKNTFTNTYAFVDMSDEVGLARVLSPDLRLLGFHIQDRLCRVKDVCSFRNLIIESNVDVLVKDIHNRVNEYLGAEFETKQYDPTLENKHTRILQLEFSDHTSAWRAHTLLSDFQNAKFVNENNDINIKIKINWIKTTSFLRSMKR